MVVGVLQFELLIHGAESLKDKRRVVSSVKDRLHREHQVSVAEVARQDNPAVAVLGVALVSADGRYAGEVLDRITAKLRGLVDAELGEVSRHLIHGVESREGFGAAGDPADDPDGTLAAELLRRGDEALGGEG
ncbi:MAG: DUF503 domain-containing protein [Phycisphaeraceae bacterium]|nr:MAG: DUF503 domain-containing protein [Phycisphaeraceae bacterium]